MFSNPVRSTNEGFWAWCNSQWSVGPRPSASNKTTSSDTPGENALFEQDKPYPGKALHQKTANWRGIVDGQELRWEH